MYTCDDCADLMLDFLYGLLEAEEVQRLRDHLAGCAACRAAMAQAEAQQGLLARATHVARQVPAFVAPAESDVKEIATAQTSEAAPAQPADVGPVTLPLASPTRRPLRRWPWLATAAALLLLTGGLYWSYQVGYQRRQAELARAKGEVETIESQFVSAARAYEKDLERLPAQVQARQLRLQVTGPAAYEADAPAQVRVVTRDAKGVPAAATLQVEVLNQAGKKMVFLQEFESRGEMAVVLPAGLSLKPDEGAQLVVQAVTSRGGKAELREPLATVEPRYDTHVVLNKPAYRPGEVVLFRTLTLDRFSLKPPGHELPLTFTLRDAHQVAVKQLQGKMQPDGIGGGEFSLIGLPADAGYSLEATPAGAGNAARLRPRSCTFTIVRAEPAAFAGGFGGGNAPSNQVSFERNLYAPGDKVRGEFRQLQNGAAAVNQTVQVNARQANGQAIPIEGAPAGKPLQTVTDARGRATFGLQLPKDMGPGRPVVEVEVADGKANARYQQDIPVAPSYPAVEFFCEGGDLVAEVPNRVFFRAQTPQGAPVDLEGRVVNREGKEVAHVQGTRDGMATGQRGMGSFTFTPRAAEAYTLQVAVAPKTQKVLPLPPVHSAGVALSVAEAVGREGQPIRAVVRSTAREGRLLILATCRGHVVDQQFLDGSPAGTEVLLSPVQGTRGIVRLTVYEVRQDQLLPRAERLVFQMPTERLVLSCGDVGKGAPRAYRPGEHVDLGIRAVNEKGELTSATCLAAVVDERALPPSQLTEQGPPAFFYLTSEIRDGADLDNADFLVSDTPEARAALDLFLGTQGWRRFSEPQPAAMLAKTTGFSGPAVVVERPAVFNRDNLDEVVARVDKELAAAREELARQAVHKREALQDERERCTAAVGMAAASLADYQDLPRRGARLTVAVLVLFLVAAGGLLLLVGFVRAVRGGRPTVAFAGAFTSLLLCLAIYGATSALREQDRGEPDGSQRAQLSPHQLPPLPEMAPAAKPKQDAKSEDRAAPVGRFAEAREHKRALSDLDAAALARAAGAEAKDTTLRDESMRRAAVADLREKAKELELKKSLLPQDEAGGATRTPQAMSRPATEKLAPARGPAPAPLGPPAPVAASPGAKGTPDTVPSPPAMSRNDPSAKPQPLSAASTADKPEALGALALRQYAYRDAGRLGAVSPDTVLWYPALLAADGTARVGFDLGGQPTTYRVLLYAHSPSGRLGAYRGQIEARK